MTWQDIVIAVVSLVFSISLLPQIYHGFKTKTGPINYLTSVPTVVSLYVLVFVYLTLALYYAAATTFLTGSSWLLLFLQRWLYGKSKLV